MCWAERNTSCIAAERGWIALRGGWQAQASQLERSRRHSCGRTIATRTGEGLGTLAGAPETKRLSFTACSLNKTREASALRRVPVIAVSAVLVAGAVLIVLPIPTQIGTTVFNSDDRVFYADNITAPVEPSTLGAHVQYEASWTSYMRDGQPAGGGIHVYDCGIRSNCSHFNPNSSPVAQGYGSSGTLNWQGQQGELFMVVPSSVTPNSNLSVDVSYAEPLYGGVPGLVILLIGIGGLVFEAVRARK